MMRKERKTRVKRNKREKKELALRKRKAMMKEFQSMLEYSAEAKSA
jgi:transposase